MSTTTTNRRSFLKTGALVAAPVAALVPAAALASDGSASRLAELESERAIEGLMRSFLRRFNGKGVDDCGEFLASSGAIRIDSSVRKIAEDSAADPAVAISADGKSASWRRRAKVELLTDFEGDSTMEKMARFQGQGSAQFKAERQLEAEFAQTDAGWTITSLKLA